MDKKIKVGIIGGAGYTGGELIRLLVNHPLADLIFVHSKSNAGKPLHAVHQDLINEADIKFSSATNDDIDVLFLCTGHGDSKKFLEENEVPVHVKIISLSQDFRLKANSVIKGKTFIYGLPEINREKIKSAEYIANPGCFASAIELGLLPLAKVDEVKDVYTTGITGSTGAGQTLSATSHFSWRQNNIQAYKSLTHQHLAEINESLDFLSGSQAASIHFIPWRGDFARGIFITSQLKSSRGFDDIYKLYNEFYKDHPFVKVSMEPIFLKQVVNTNYCFIHLEKEEDNLVVHSTLDNLLKGASGQALQNMNLMFNIEETMGLKLKANYF
ncbi:N-acetyl-gamma-glutamyl-phosphate reductase [Ginsengibacter hankyongi]|uniref:N-acetyl-gamma-glutamyl-phosphate reductase n=1 Tax=Ginsengibacter hankyongi TaxID=2607284 RepID=A0A5J5IFW0_9BACT|nr:N-acetyl-gamma-glutamyl-phosphate reductase [Ginsengibacter hankyongi]KAA9039074.1 N-acetyl-gamma-glutamyl-phosphate reductase [Ginsengibacter hankyongi]